MTQNQSAAKADPASAPEPVGGAQRGEILDGLRADAAAISPKFFYDRLGSSLFSAICELDEYYPTRTEALILPEAARRTAELVGQGSTLIDLGAGDCRKASALLPLLGCSDYLGVDISIDYLREAVAGLSRRNPGVRTRAIARDLMRGWQIGPLEAPGCRLFFYPGSSIGNFTPEDARGFLARVHRNAGIGGYLLIGVDLVKDRAVMEAAYDDALGVTAAFNLNALRHVNRLAGTNFDVSQWRHVAYFDATHSRIEMHLEARATLTVSWGDGSRDFVAGQRIHTENSYKYSPSRFEALLESAHWQQVAHWVDPRKWFAVYLVRAGA